MAVNIGVNIQRSPNRINQALREAGVNGQYPKLLFNFEDNYYLTNGSSKSLNDAFTFTRNGNATMVDSDGLIKWAPHNLLSYSESFDDASWTKGGITSGGPSVTPDVVASPDGDVTADEIDYTNTTSGQFVRKTISYLGGTFGSISVWAYSPAVGGSPTIRITTNNTVAWGTGVSQSFNLTTGWQLLTLTDVLVTNASTMHVMFGAAKADGTVDTSVFGKVYLWGAHLYRSDLGGMVNNPVRGDSYVPTTSSAVYMPRVGHHKYNGDQWVDKGGLFESEARTNLITYSNDFSSDWTTSSASLTADQLTSPDGQVNASLLAGNGSSSFPTLAYALSISSTTTVTFSFHVKANTADEVFVRFAGTNVNGGTVSVTGFNFATETFDTRTGTAATSSNYEKLANGWYRLSVTVTGDAFTDVSIRPEFNNANTDSVYIYGAQLEAARTPSSYIPTNGASVTRAAESITVPYANLPWPTPTYIGDELIVNGDFSDGTNNWNALFGSISVTNGVLRVSEDGGDASTARTNQTITTEIGKVYLLSVDLVDTNKDFEIYVNTTSNYGGAIVSVAGDNTPQTLTLPFVATATTTFITLGSGDPSAGSYAEYDNVSVREINPLSVSIAMMGEINYSGSGSDSFFQWRLDSNTYINDVFFSDYSFISAQKDGSIYDQVATAPNYFTGDLNEPFDIASRHGSTFINAAVDGIALTANTTPVLLPALSSSDLLLAYDFNGTISEFRIFDRDIGDTGIAEATKPSTEPSLSLTFDGQPSSFTNTGLTL